MLVSPLEGTVITLFCHTQALASIACMCPFLLSVWPESPCQVMLVSCWRWLRDHLLSFLYDQERRTRWTVLKIYFLLLRDTSATTTKQQLDSLIQHSYFSLSLRIIESLWRLWAHHSSSLPVYWEKTSKKTRFSPPHGESILLSLQSWNSFKELVRNWKIFF